MQVKHTIIQHLLIPVISYLSSPVSSNTLNSEIGFNDTFLSILSQSSLSNHQRWENFNSIARVRSNGVDM